MGRRWVPIVIVLFGGLLGLAVAGVPSRRHDPPITVRAEPAPTSSQSTAEQPTTPPPSSSPPTSLRPTGEVRVMVFNSSDVTGAATRVGARIRAKGWNLKTPGADHKPQGNSVVMYRAGYDNEARSLAAELELEAGSVVPLDTAIVSASDADLAVLVGNELAKRTS